MGLEQEFFLVDEVGVPSDRADEFLSRCRQTAEAEGLDPARFAPECVMSLVEINTPPASSFAELSEEYLRSLDLALRTGRELGLRLYPLATYPLPMRPTLRDEPSYQAQAQIIGYERFLHAGRCAGVHLHLEVAPGTVDPQSGVACGVPPRAREELLNVYNLATALDPALVALGRTCPFCEGEATGLASRTAYYRGDPDFAPHGLYAELGAVGGLRPYAEDVEELVGHQFAAYHAWLSAMERAGVERRLFEETVSGVLDAAWNPVRIKALGEGASTVELRSIDSNYPEMILAAISLVHGAWERVRHEDLAVKPTAGTSNFEVAGKVLRVPDFGRLTTLLRAATTRGAKSPEVAAYLDSVFRFVGEEDELRESFRADGHYRSTEDGILEGAKMPGARVPEDEGLRIVREACDELEAQSAALRRIKPPETSKAALDGIKN